MLRPFYHFMNNCIQVLINDEYIWILYEALHWERQVNEYSFIVFN